MEIEMKLKASGISPEDLDCTGGKFIGVVTLELANGQDIRIYNDSTSWSGVGDTLFVTLKGCYDNDEEDKEKAYAIAEHADYSGARIKDIYVDEDLADEEFGGRVPRFRVLEWSVYADGRFYDYEEEREES